MSEHGLTAGRLLDLGCGPRDQAEPARHLGLDYVGVDIANSAADLLADAHAIPFSDHTFDAILAYAVFEHLHNPFLAIREMERVLKPGGILLGTVSQGEPFHSSFFHHTAWGLVSLLHGTASLRMARIWVPMDTLRSLANMGRYSRIVKWALGALDLLNRLVPVLTPRKLKWPEKDKAMDRLYRAGSLAFVAVKEPAAEQRS